MSDSEKRNCRFKIIKDHKDDSDQWSAASIQVHPFKSKKMFFSVALVKHALDESDRGIRIFHSKDDHEIKMQTEEDLEFFVAEDRSLTSDYVIKLDNTSDGQKLIKVYPDYITSDQQMK